MILRESPFSILILRSVGGWWVVRCGLDGELLFCKENAIEYESSSVSTLLLLTILNATGFFMFLRLGIYLSTTKNLWTRWAPLNQTTKCLLPLGPSSDRSRNL